jgi:hypothetical protein
MFQFMSFTAYENLLAHCMPYLRQPKLFLPYEQHNALVIYSLKFFVAKKSVSNVHKLTQTVLLVMDPVNVCQVFAPRPNLVLAALVQQNN